MRITSLCPLSSAMRLLTRFSSSPRSLAPEMSRGTSSCSTRFPRRKGGRGDPSGVRSATMAWARPSAQTGQHWCCRQDCSCPLRHTRT